jgi:hypothetical protein
MFSLAYENAPAGENCPPFFFNLAPSGRAHREHRTRAFHLGELFLRVQEAHS